SGGECAPGGGGEAPRTFPDSYPPPGKAGPPQTANDRRTTPHGVPKQTSAVILDHQNDRPLVDSKMIRRHPPAGWAVFHHISLIERRLKPINLRHAQMHLCKVADRRNDDLRCEWERRDQIGRAS